MGLNDEDRIHGTKGVLLFESIVKGWISSDDASKLSEKRLTAKQNTRLTVRGFCVLLVSWFAVFPQAGSNASDLQSDSLHDSSRFPRNFSEAVGCQYGTRTGHSFPNPVKRHSQKEDWNV